MPGELLTFGRLETMRAEIYRAHPIQGADTVFVDAAIVPAEGGGARPVHFTMTHACEPPTTTARAGLGG